MMRALSSLLLVALVTSMAGCVPPPKLSIDPPKVGPQSVFDELYKLPKPNSEPMIVGVYDFRDETGQKMVSSKPVSPMATAIPQGLSSILVQELKRAGDGKFYRVVEREHIGSLLNERSIVISTLGVGNEDQLTPLLLPGILITGGAVSYDRSVTQQLNGLGFISINGTREVITDQVGVVLRAVSVKSGEILVTVYAQKTVKSIRNGVSALQILGIDLLAFEAGSASNEPVSLAVRKAIAAAVLELTKEGIKSGWWEAEPQP